MAFTDDQIDQLQAAAGVGAVLSLVGSLLILFLYFRSSHPNLHMKCIFYMSLADIFFSLSLALGSWPIGKSGLCEFQGFITQFGLSTVMWTGVLAVNFFCHVVKILHDDFLSKYYKYYHLVGWGPAFLLAIVALSSDMYGDAGLWCWIDKDHETFRFVFWYIPIWCVFVLNSALIAWVAFHLSSFLTDPDMQTSDKNRARRVIYQSFGFLVIFVIIWIPPTINRLNSLITGNDNFTLALLHATFVPLQGAGNFFVYVGPIFYSHLKAYRSGDTSVRKLFTLQSARPSHVQSHSEEEESISFDIRNRMSTTVGGDSYDSSHPAPVRLSTMDGDDSRMSALSDGMAGGSEDMSANEFEKLKAPSDTALGVPDTTSNKKSASFRL